MQNATPTSIQAFSASAAPPTPPSTTPAATAPSTSPATSATTAATASTRPPSSRWRPPWPPWWPRGKGTWSCHRGSSRPPPRIRRARPSGRDGICRRPRIRPTLSTRRMALRRAPRIRCRTKCPIPSRPRDLKQENKSLFKTWSDMPNLSFRDFDQLRN